MIDFDLMWSSALAESQARLGRFNPDVLDDLGGPRPGGRDADVSVRYLPLFREYFDTVTRAGVTPHRQDGAVVAFEARVAVQVDLGVFHVLRDGRRVLQMRAPANAALGTIDTIARARFGEPWDAALTASVPHPSADIVDLSESPDTASITDAGYRFRVIPSDGRPAGIVAATRDDAVHIARAVELGWDGVVATMASMQKNPR